MFFKSKSKLMYAMAVMMAAIALILTPSLSQAAEEGAIRIEAGAGYGFAHFHGRYGEDFVYHPGFQWPEVLVGYESAGRASINLRFTFSTGEASTNDYTGDWEWGYTSLAVDLRYAFMPENRFSPYVMLGFPLFYWMALANDEDDYISTVGLYFLDSQEDFGAIELGGGFNFYLDDKKHFAVGALAIYHFAVFNEMSIEIENVESDTWRNTWGGVGTVFLTVSYRFFI